ncbi:HalOD1 output domain-containing protein [Halopiger thermotolerans]
MRSVLADRSPVHRTHFDPSAPDQLLDAVVTAVATVADRDPASIPPLAETADFGALGALIDHARRTGSPIEATAIVEGLDVRVRSDGRILVYDRPGEDAVAAPALPQSSPSGSEAACESGSNTDADADTESD